MLHEKFYLFLYIFLHAYIYIAKINNFYFLNLMLYIIFTDSIQRNHFWQQIY